MPKLDTSAQYALPEGKKPCISTRTAVCPSAAPAGIEPVSVGFVIPTAIAACARLRVK